MAFIVNGSEWDFSGMPSADAEALIDRALEFIEISYQRGEDVAVGDDFQTRAMRGAEALWDLFSPTSPLPLRRELSQELSAWLVKAPRYADAPHWPNGFGGNPISIEGAAPVANDDVEWVHFAVRAGTPMACMTLGQSRLATTTTGTGTAQVHFAGDEAGRKVFWRDAMVLAGDTLRSLVDYAERAYPNLHFVGCVLSDAAGLSGGYIASRRRLRAALETLDDWGHWVFTWPPPALAPNEGLPPDPDARPTNYIIEHRFAGFNIEAAPENPNVRFHTESRKAREIQIKGRTLYCEWHVKLQPHQNRIYFHGPVPESGDKVVIGIIDRHLPLP